MGKKQKRFQHICIPGLGIVILAAILMVAYLRTDIVHAQQTYRKEVEVYCDDIKNEEDLNEKILREIVNDEYEIEENDIIITSVIDLKTEYSVGYEYTKTDYYSEYLEDMFDYTPTDYTTVIIENASNYSDDQLKQKIIEQLASEVQGSRSNITIVELREYYCTYEVNYTLYSESDEYKKSVADFFGAPSTSKDSKAELSKVSLYIQGCRMSYLLEDNGEFYIPSNDLYYIDYDVRDLLDLNPKKSFYNLNWTTATKTGTVIGSIKKDSDEQSYIINKKYYRKLSEVLPDWRKNLSYDKGLKAFIYGTKPDSQEKNLKKDVIYEFVKKTTKGCKTTKEKIKALHDAIVLKCTYDTKNMSYNSKLIKNYEMIYSQNMVLHMLLDKKGICENYARLFKECCDRLFIPCDLVSGITSGDHMWNRVYIGSKSYHIDLTYADYINNKYKKPSDISRQYFLKPAYDFMGSHYWSDPDYKSYKFSKDWKKIDRNNIKTTEDLRKAVLYASYEYRLKGTTKCEFKITGKNVDISCCVFIIYNGYTFGVGSSYNKDTRVLTVTYNKTR